MSKVFLHKRKDGISKPLMIGGKVATSSNCCCDLCHPTIKITFAGLGFPPCCQTFESYSHVTFDFNANRSFELQALPKEFLPAGSECFWGGSGPAANLGNPAGDPEQIVTKYENGPSDCSTDGIATADTWWVVNVRKTTSGAWTIWYMSNAWSSAYYFYATVVSASMPDNPIPNQMISCSDTPYLIDVSPPTDGPFTGAIGGIATLELA